MWRAVPDLNYMFYSSTYTAQINPFSLTLNQTDLINAGFSSGQTVFVKVYGESFWGNEYLDSDLNKMIFPNLNLSTTNSVSFIVP